MKRQPRCQTLTLFRISDSFGVTLKNACRKTIGIFLNRWRSWLSQSIDTNHTIKEVSKGAVDCLLWFSMRFLLDNLSPPHNMIYSSLMTYRINILWFI